MNLEGAYKDIREGVIAAANGYKRASAGMQSVINQLAELGEKGDSAGMAEFESQREKLNRLLMPDLQSMARDSAIYNATTVRAIKLLQGK